MKHYTLIIKSHTDAPDFEVEFEALNKEDAIKYLENKYDLGKEVIEANILEENGS